MPIFGGWIVRALASRLGQPGRRAQRRFMFIVCIALTGFLVWSLVFLWRQSTPDALENAAIFVFAAMGVLIFILLLFAYIVRKRTGADKPSWGVEEARRMVHPEDKQN